MTALGWALYLVGKYIAHGGTVGRDGERGWWEDYDWDAQHEEMA